MLLDPGRTGALVGRPCLICLACSTLLLVSCSNTTPSSTVPKGIAQAKSAQRFSFLVAPTKQEQFAQQLLAAVDAGDIKTLLQYSDPAERKEMNFSEATLKPIVDLYQRERKNVRALGIVECVPSTGKGTICMETLRADDTDFQIDGMIYQTPSGPHALISQILLRGTENIIWARSSGRQQGGPEMNFHIRTFEAFRKELEPKGIKGLVFLSWQDGSVRLETWDTLLRRFRAQLKEPLYGSQGRRGRGF